MEDLILYGSQYGHTRRYAEELSRAAGVPAISWRDAPELGDRGSIVYLGALYAGGVLGLTRTLKRLSLREGQRLIVATVGLADPADLKNREHLRRSLEKQLPPGLLSRTRLFHLRAGIDYGALSLRHRLMMAALCRSLRGRPAEQLSAEDRALLESYGGQVDFTDFRTLEPILQALK